MSEANRINQEYDEKLRQLRETSVERDRHSKKIRDDKDGIYRRMQGVVTQKEVQIFPRCMVLVHRLRRIKTSFKRFDVIIRRPSPRPIWVVFFCVRGTQSFQTEFSN